MTEETIQQLKGKLEEIRKQLLVVGNKESNFMGVEMLFYDAITLARSYSNDPENNYLLYQLKQLEAGAYSKTKNYFKKSHQREHVIRRFIVQFRNILTTAIKDNMFTNTLSAS